MSDLAPTKQASVDSPHLSRTGRLGLLADLHYDPTEDDADQLLADIEHAVTRFETMDIDRLVVLGDHIMEGEDAAADRDRLTRVREQLESASLENDDIIYLMGNHDVMHLDADEAASVMGQETAYGTFELTDQITGVYLNSAGERYADGRGYVTSDQLDFLASTLETHDNVVLFVHHPIHYHELSDENWFANHPECAFCANKYRLEELIAESDSVLATVNGHTHLRHHCEYKDVHHITVNAAQNERPTNQSPTGMHAVLDISQSRLHTRHYHRDDADPVTETLIPFVDDARVALGGTFDPVHAGHRHLFTRAFQLGELVIGMTSDELAPRTRHEPRFVLPFQERKASLEAVLGELSQHHDREFTVNSIDDPTGIVTDDPDITHLIVTPETAARAVDVNQERIENGHPPLTIEVVEPLTAEDGGRISSTRICNGEIDPYGNLTPNANGRQPLDQ